MLIDRYRVDLLALHINKSVLEPVLLNSGLVQGQTSIRVETPAHMTGRHRVEFSELRIRELDIRCLYKVRLSGGRGFEKLFENSDVGHARLVVGLVLGNLVIRRITALDISSHDDVERVHFRERTAGCKSLEEFVHVISVSVFDMQAQRLGVGFEFVVKVCGDLDGLILIFRLHCLCGHASRLLKIRLLGRLGGSTFLERLRHVGLRRFGPVAPSENALC